MMKNLQYILVLVGIVLVPFYDVIFRLFPNVTVIAGDTRLQREAIAVIIALGIGLLALYRGTKPFKNKWLLFFMFVQLVSIRMIPKIPMVINGVDNSIFWVWKPLFEVLCFVLMLVGITSVDWDKKKVDNIFMVMAWTGFIMACYIILQSLGMDQYNMTKGKEIIGSTQFPGRVGTLGQPTLVSPFVAMLVPIALYLRKYIFALAMIVAVYLTHSQMAMGALIIGLIAYVCLNRPRSSFLIIPAFIGTAVYLFMKKIVVIGDNGRFAVWKIAFEEMLDTHIKIYEGIDFSFFGHGLGSFKYISGAVEASKYGSVHNEYLEIFYCCGIVGLVLFLTAIIYILVKSFKSCPSCKMIALMSSFAIISLCAFGTFVWHLGVYSFLTVVIVGLLINETTNKGERCLRS